MAFAIGSSDISTEFWQTVLGALECKFSKPVFEMWIKPMRVVSLEDADLTIAVQNAFALNWAENRLKDGVTEVIRELLQVPIDLHFVVVEGAQPAGSPRYGRAPSYASVT